MCMTEKVSCLPNQFCIDIVACNAAENKLKILRFYTRQRRPANPPMLEPYRNNVTLNTDAIRVESVHAPLSFPGKPKLLASSWRVSPGKRL